MRGIRIVLPWLAELNLTDARHAISNFPLCHWQTAPFQAMRSELKSFDPTLN